MISYIADIKTSSLLEKICKRKNILILNTQNTEINLKMYVKETKVNFSLIKYLFIELSLLQNTEQEIIETIYNFSKIYNKARIIIFAPDYEEQNIILTNLYDLGFYNIINETDEIQIETKLNKILDIGLSQKDSKRFEKRVEKIQKESKFKNVINKIKKVVDSKSKKKIKKTNKLQSNDMPSNSVYLFSLLLESITRLIKFICYILVFVLTSIGLTILLNEELRKIVFQIFGLK